MKLSLKKRNLLWPKTENFKGVVRIRYLVSSCSSSCFYNDPPHTHTHTSHTPDTTNSSSRTRRQTRCARDFCSKDEEGGSKSKHGLITGNEHIALSIQTQRTRHKTFLLRWDKRPPGMPFCWCGLLMCYVVNVHFFLPVIGQDDIYF